MLTFRFSNALAPLLLLGADRYIGSFATRTIKKRGHRDGGPRD
jgi:hypothetical protein